MKTLIFCAALVAIAAPATAGAVQPVNGDSEFPQASVSYADLDLSRPAGADIMVARIRRAARQVCGQELFADLDRARTTRACIRHAMDSAIGQVDAPLVTARYFDAKSPTKLAAR